MATPQLTRQLVAANALFQRGQRAAALKQFAELRESYPRSGHVWLESAFAYDFLSREAEAVPLYRRALRLGVPKALRRDAQVCMGSSLRTVGQYRAAIRVLRQAMREFPGDVVVILFLALAYYDAGQPAQAVRLLGQHCIGVASLGGFGDVLRRKYGRL